MSLCDTTDHSLSLPTIAHTCDVIGRFMTISSDEQICYSMFIMAQHTLRPCFEVRSEFENPFSARRPGISTHDMARCKTPHTSIEWFVHPIIDCIYSITKGGVWRLNVEFTNISCFSGDGPVWMSQRMVLIYVVKEQILCQLERSARQTLRLCRDNCTRAGKSFLNWLRRLHLRYNMNLTRATQTLWEGDVF
jgi:hypothetical protein